MELKRLVKALREDLALSSDELQNALILIAHHVQDIREGVKTGAADYALRGLGDIDEVLTDLSKFLDAEHRANLQKVMRG